MVAVDVDESGRTVAVSSWKYGEKVEEEDASKHVNKQSGAVYVFSNDGDEWRQEARIVATDAEEGDRFGRDVSISGDGGTLLVGAYHDDERSGSAYLFRRGGDGGWAHSPKIQDADSTANELFGSHVALDGKALIGKPGDSNDNGVASGAVYVVESLDQC